MNKLPSLSIFFPAFNEEQNIENSVNEALELAPKISNTFEIIVVDDGSTDRTAEIVLRLSLENKSIRLVKHPANLGYGAALRTGFENSKLEYITYMDSDGQFSFSELNKLIEKINEADIVAGFRISRADSFTRILSGKIWNLIVSLVLNIRLKDMDCGFKLIKKEVLDKVKLESKGATISGELLVKAKRAGFKIVQVGLIHKPRRFGAATGGNPIHIFRALKDLVVLLTKL